MNDKLRTVNPVRTNLTAQINKATAPAILSKNSIKFGSFIFVSDRYLKSYKIIHQIPRWRRIIKSRYSNYIHSYVILLILNKSSVSS